MGQSYPHGRADYFKGGDWDARCSICGQKYKATELIRHWTGQYRCDKCWDPRHPQDFARGVPDVSSVPWTQDPEDLGVLVCTLNGQASVAGLGVAGCMRAGNSFWQPGTT